MTEKPLQFIGLLLLFTIVMACAFRLISPLRPVQASTGKDVQGEQSFSPNSGLEVGFARNAGQALRRMESISMGDEILNSATNEEEILSRLRDWARKDPEAALAWGRQQPDNEERIEVLTDACFQIARVDPERAVTLAEQFKLNKDAVLENLAQQWAAEDLTTAYNWIMAQPASDQRDALTTGMTFVWSQSEPFNAAEFVAQEMPPGTMQDEAVIMVLHQWALVDPDGASAWVQQFPESPLRDRAVNELSGIEEYKQRVAKSE